MLHPLGEVELPIVRGCPASMNPLVNEDNLLIIQGEDIGGTVPNYSNSPAKQASVGAHDEIISSLTPEEVKELFTVFSRVDGGSGICDMTEFVNTLNKMRVVDETGILKRSYRYFRKSLGASKLTSFRSFKAIIELLIPAMSSSDVDNLLLKSEKAANNASSTLTKS